MMLLFDVHLVPLNKFKSFVESYNLTNFSKEMARTKVSRAKSASKSEKKSKDTSEIAKPGMDPKPPKEPVTPFKRYRDEVFAEYKEKMPDRTVASITQTIAHKWLKLSDKQKEKYNQEFLDDLNNRYLPELEKFEKKHGPVKHKQFSLEDPPLKGMYYNSVAGTGKIFPLEPEDKMKKGGRGGAKYQEILSDDEDEEERPEEEEEEEVTDEVRQSRRGRRGRPAPPKKPQTPFFLFKAENFEAMKRKHPKANAPEISSLLADAWHTLSKNARKKYEDKHEKLMEKYEQEMKEYEAQHGHVERRRAPKSPSPQRGKKPRLSNYEMKVSDRMGTRPQIFPGEEMIGNKPRDPSRRRKPPVPI